MYINFLADISRCFFNQKKIIRRGMKKVSEMTDEEVITACHFYCEHNNLTEEWNDFRKECESKYNYCSYSEDFILPERCYTMQMIAFENIKSTTLPNGHIDIDELLKHCNNCDHKWL